MHHPKPILLNLKGSLSRIVGSQVVPLQSSVLGACGFSSPELTTMADVCMRAAVASGAAATAAQDPVVAISGLANGMQIIPLPGRVSGAAVRRC